MKDEKRLPVLPSELGFAETVGLWPKEPLGSYTGVPADDDVPVQDADDL